MYTALLAYFCVIREGTGQILLASDQDNAEDIIWKLS